MTVAKTNGTTATTTNSQVEKEKEALNVKLNPEEKEVNEENDEEIELTPEDFAPDGGWGWMVALSMVLVFITSIGPGASFGLVFGDFLEETGQAGTATTMFNSVFMTTFSISGLMTNSLVKKYCIRTIGVVGAVLFSVPNVCLAFVTDVYQMAFIYILQGLGLGFIITICNTTFNAYFVKKRAQVMSVAQVIIGMGGIVYPICIEKMMKMYGFRGTAALTGALSLNCIVGMTMMHPVEWHSKKLAKMRAEKERQKRNQKWHNMAASNRRSTIDVIHFSAKTKWSSMRSLKDETGKEVPLLIEMYKSPASRVASISEIEGGVPGRTRSGSTWEPLTRRMSTLSASSLANLVTGVGVLGDIRQLQLQKSRELCAERTVHTTLKDNVQEIQMKRKESIDKRKQSESDLDIFSELLEMSLLKDRGFLNICLGISFVFTSDYVFSVLLPLMMTNNGYSKSDAAFAVTVSATAELISRILLAIFTLIVNVKAKYLFFGAMVFMTLAKIVFLFFEHTLMGALISIVIIGMVRSWLLVPQPLVIIEDIPIDKFASAYGIFAVISGIISIVFSPIVGIVKDWTNSFQVCQLALLAMGALFIVPWALQFIMVNLPKRRERKGAIALPTSETSSGD